MSLRQLTTSALLLVAVTVSVVRGETLSHSLLPSASVETSSSLPASAFGEVCDGVFDNSNVYTQAIDAAIKARLPLEIGRSARGACLVRSTIHISGHLTGLHGSGSGSTVITSTQNGPTFLWHVNGDEPIRDAYVHDIGFRSLVGQNNILTRAIVITGNATSWFSYNTFARILCEGHFACIEIDKDTFVTPFGRESRNSFNRFTAITSKAGSARPMYTILFHRGSGTGNIFSNFQGTQLTPGGSFLRFESEEDGTVVGDIVMTSSQLGGDGVYAISIGKGRNGTTQAYRARIAITSSQLDAGMAGPFDFPSDEPPFTSILYTSNNNGGNTRVVLPEASHSRIMAGSPSNWTAQGPPRSTDYRSVSDMKQAVPIFNVAVGSNTAVNCKVMIVGSVGGIGVGGRKSEFWITSNKTTALITPGEEGGTTKDERFFHVAPEVFGRIAKFLVVFTQTQNSFFNSDIECSGGTFSVVTP